MHERNAKVRRRIAAGKFRLRIRDLRNLGPRAEQQLAGVGIHSAELLRRRGALAAYTAVIRAAEGKGSLNLLWALVGALEPWPPARYGCRCCWRSRRREGPVRGSKRPPVAGEGERRPPTWT